MLETTAGQGTCLGGRFEHLAEIIQRVDEPERLGICFDTCHVFAAGYDLRERKDYLATMRRFNQLIGCKFIRAFHLNDSRRELGSHVDRHEHIGRGQLGLEPFRHLLTDRRFRPLSASSSRPLSASSSRPLSASSSRPLSASSSRRLPMYLETPKGIHRGTDWDKINLRALRRLAEG